MNFFSISGLLIGILCAILGLLTLFKGKKSVHYIWAFFSFSVALWGFGSYKIGIATDYEAAIFWWRIGYVGVILIPVFFTHFVITFLELKKKWIVALSYIFGIVFLFANFYDGLFINKIHFLFNQFYYLSSPPLLYSAFIFIFFGLVVYSHVKILQTYKESVGIKRSQIKYFLLATIPGFLAGAFEFLPVYKIEFYPYFHLIIVFSPLIVTYAILRYRLMDLRIIARKAVIYFVSAGFVYGMFYFVAWIYNQFFGGLYNKNAYISGLIIAPLFVLIFVWFNDKIKFIANKYLFFSLYSYQETINNLSQRLNYLNDLNEIVGLIVETVKQTMQLDRAGVLLVSQSDGMINYKIAKVIGFNEENGISLVEDNFLTKYLLEKQKPLIREELTLLARDARSAEEKEKFTELEGNMKLIEASLCIPLMSSKKLIGIIVLGSKVSGDAYTSEDLELLNTLSYQAGIAVDNARLYKEIRDLNENLQQKVDEQTKEIREQKEKVEKALEVEKQAHEELKKLDEAKTSFMLVTQHHLRTPLTVTMGFLDLLLKGIYGKIPKNISAVIEKANESIKKEIGVVNDLLTVSTFQLGRGLIRFTADVSIKNMLEEIATSLKPIAETQGIYLKLKEQDNIPKTSADPNQIRMALTNVIDNAIKYTRKGGISINLKTENKKIIIEVQDTGIGMSAGDQKELFKAFQRAKEAWTTNATGKGIGLYLSAQIIKAHGGKIWAESEGKNKGSTFYIELPVR